MILYRVDKRNFKVGEYITPNIDSFIQENDIYKETKLLVEGLFEKHRPKEKPKRNEVLMLFSNHYRAKRHWSIYSDSILYEVEIEEMDILHIGDYEKVESLYKGVNQNQSEDILQEIISNYWQQIEVIEPELFVMQATVIQVLGSEIQRQQILKDRLGIKPMERDQE